MGLFTKKQVATVLVVDHDFDNALPTMQELQGQGWRTVYADSGREALNLLVQDKIDSVVIDEAFISDMNALDLVHAIKTGSQRPVSIYVNFTHPSWDTKSKSSVWKSSAIPLRAASPML